MTRIWMVNGQWFDIDDDVDDLGEWINHALASGYFIVEIGDWMYYDRYGEKQRRPEEERLIINLNHVMRLDPS